MWVIPYCFDAVAMFVDKFSYENGCDQDGDVLGVSWPLPCGLASSRGINTFSSSFHTPVADMIKGLWSDILYLVDVFYVV